MIPEFYIARPQWRNRIEEILESLGRIDAFEERSRQPLELRRANRIGSVHSSTAIEGNMLSLAQVAAVAHGEPVLADQRQIQEVANALAAYEAIDTLNPWSVDDFLHAHGLLTAGLQPEAGAFRSVDVEIVNAHGDVIHTGSRAEKVPRLVAELLEWGAASTDHPIVVSSAVHLLIEHIHPFRDGNGRIGRLWQTLILSQWRPVFAWMPTETLIRQHQASYYEALQASREPEINEAPFVDFMIRVITDSLGYYEEQARRGTARVGDNVGDHVGVDEAILTLLRRDPTLSAAALGAALGTTSRTIERHLAALRDAGRVRR